MFACLGRAGINIQMVSTSEIKIAVIIDEKEAERAARLIHAEFGLGRLLPQSRDAAAGLNQGAAVSSGAVASAKAASPPSEKGWIGNRLT